MYTIYIRRVTGENDHSQKKEKNQIIITPKSNLKRRFNIFLIHCI